MGTDLYVWYGTSAVLHFSIFNIFVVRNIFVVFTSFIQVGGATGLIGDPSGRKAERDAMTQQKLDENITGIKNDISRFLYFSDSGGALLLNNVKWYKNVNFIDFLSDVGRCFRMASMLGRESVRQRLGQVEGMSYSEFSYQILQGLSDIYFLVSCFFVLSVRFLSFTSRTRLLPANWRQWYAFVTF